jgi:hypothetical protein
MTITSIPNSRSSQALGQTFDGKLRGVVGRKKRRRDPPADRADIHDPAGRALQALVGAEKRGERLRRAYESGKIDLDLRTKITKRQFEQRAADTDAGVVDQPSERTPGKRAAHLRGGGFHRGLVGDVEQQRDEQFAKLGGETFGVGALAHAAEHAKAFADEDFCRAPADAGRSAGNHDAAHATSDHASAAFKPASPVPPCLGRRCR